MGLFAVLNVKQLAFVQHLNSMLMLEDKRKRKPGPNIPFLSIKLRHFLHWARGSAVSMGEPVKTTTVVPKNVAPLHSLFMSTTII